MKEPEKHRLEHERKEHERIERKRGGKAEGGAMSDDPKKGFDAAKEDLEDKPMRYTADSKVNSEAEERKHGGHVRRRRARGGEIKHHKECKCERCMGGRAERKAGGKAEEPKHHKAKHVGEVHGEHAMHHAGRKPRKSGGRAYSDSNPLTSAAHGTPPKGHSVEDINDD